MDNIYHKDRTSWHYIDLEDFEYQIRQEMTSNSVNCRRRARQRRAAEHERKIAKAKYFAIQKLVGMLIIVGTIMTAMLLNGADMSFAFITVPIGLLMVFSREKCLVIGRRRKRNRGHAGA